MATRFEVQEDDLSRDETKQLLALHLSGMQDNSPEGSVFALDLSGLQDPAVTVWTAWCDGQIASVGALKELDACGEIKSMRTHPAFLRTGAGSAILDHILAEAKRRGLKRISLETGSGEAFEPALALYRKRGFVEGGAFSNYEKSAFNQFLHLDLP